MERRDILKCANLCGAWLLGLGSASLVQAADPRDNADATTSKPLTLRPYQLMCTICSLGEEGGKPAKQYEKCKQIRDAVHANPDVPITLACHAGALYDFQEPDVKEDTPEGEEFNRKRDLDVLQILDMPPGCTLPARALFTTLLKGISTVSGICGYDAATGDAWKGCPLAASGNYERGHEKAVKEAAGAWYNHLPRRCLYQANPHVKYEKGKRELMKKLKLIAS